METASSLYIPIRRAYKSRLGEVDWDNLQMGAHASDHMLISDYVDGQWQDPGILPFGAFSLLPTAGVFHYGQTIFEGMKAFRMQDGRVQIFRPEKHYERFVLSADRMCMPVVSKEVFIEGLRRLVELDKDWVPGQAGSALYLRPFIIASGSRLSVGASDQYRFTIVTSPAGSYYSRPVRVKVERQFVRAARGGTGFAKCGGNYGGALYPTRLARDEGYDQVLWTDSGEHRYMEESGMMNVFFVIGGTLVTPPLSDSILDGVTRDTLIVLAKDAGIPVEERPVSVEELLEGFAKGKITEAFGAGTAAVVSPIRAIGIDGRDYDLPVTAGGLATQLKETLDDIRYGRRPDTYGWNFPVEVD